MPWSYVTTLAITQTGGGSGPNPTDAFSVRIGIPETNNALTDTLSLAFQFSDVVLFQADGANISITFPETNAAPTDSLTILRITHSESNSAPSDNGTFQLRPSYSDSVNTPGEASSLRISGLGDSNPVPGETRQVMIQYWGQNAAAVNSTGAALSSTASTNMAPANANGANNGTLAIVRTAIGGVADTTNPVCLLTSQFGAAALLFPPNVVSQKLRVWFQIPAGTIGTDVVRIQYRTDGVTNSDAGWTNLFTWAPNPAVNFLTNPLELAVNFTQAQADSLVMRVRYQAAVTTTPDSRVDLDAWCLAVVADV